MTGALGGWLHPAFEAAALLTDFPHEAVEPWTGGHRMPNFTFEPGDYVDAYDERTQARLRRAIRRYDPRGVMAVGRVLFA